MLMFIIGCVVGVLLVVLTIIISLHVVEKRGYKSYIDEYNKKSRELNKINEINKKEE